MRVVLCCVSETTQPTSVLMWPDKSFPYKALMFAKCCVSVQLVQLRSPGGLKIVLFRCCFCMVMLSDSAGEIQVKGRCNCSLNAPLGAICVHLIVFILLSRGSLCPFLSFSITSVPAISLF